MDTTLAELRHIKLRMMELEAELAQLRNLELEMLELNTGTRKPKKDMVTPAHGKALFAGLKRRPYELGKA